MTGADMLADPQLLQAIKDEFKERKGDTKYEALLPEGPPRITGS